MQNKPNFRKAQINASSFLTKNYDNEITFRLRKNKPKQTQFKSEGRSEEWNLSHSSYDSYYRIMRKSRDQIYDELLVLKCQAGDREAFQELVDRWQKRLWQYAFRVTGRDSAAWDVVQETWVAIVKGIKRVNDVAAFPGWAFRILNNKCVDWLRQQQSESRAGEELAARTSSANTTGQNSHEQVALVRMAIGKLPTEQQALLALRYSEGFTIEQIAKVLGLPEGTVKSRVHRTLEKLRQMLGTGHDE